MTWHDDYTHPEVEPWWESPHEALRLAMAREPDRPYVPCRGHQRVCTHSRCIEVAIRECSWEGCIEPGSVTYPFLPGDRFCGLHAQLVP